MCVGGGGGGGGGGEWHGMFLQYLASTCPPTLIMGRKFQFESREKGGGQNGTCKKENGLTIIYISA